MKKVAKNDPNLQWDLGVILDPTELRGLENRLWQSPESFMTPTWIIPTFDHRAHYSTHAYSTVDEQMFTFLYLNMFLQSLEFKYSPSPRSDMLCLGGMKMVPLRFHRSSLQNKCPPTLDDWGNKMWVRVCRLSDGSFNKHDRLLKMYHNQSSERADCLASGVADCSFFKNRSSKQLHSQHCTPLGPQQYTRQVWSRSDEWLSR